MIRIRPINLGYLLIYLIAAFIFVLTLLIMIYSQDVFSIICGILCSTLFSIFVYYYSREHVQLSAEKITVVACVWLKREGKSQAIPILFTQGKLEQRIVKSEFRLSDLDKYGYIHDLGLRQKEYSPSGGYIVREVAFVLKDGIDCRLNIEHYTKNQVKKLLTYVYESTSILPQGKLNELIK